LRKRIVDKPYVLVSDYDRTAAMKKAWITRRAEGKPYPESARNKSRARAVQRVNNGFAVSKFERKAAEVMIGLGFDIRTSVPFRGSDGQFVGVSDIVLPARRIIVECHGTYFHGGRFSWQDIDKTQLRNLGREEVKCNFLKQTGWEVRILWEHDFNSDPRGAVLAVVR
jgi:G:T-mismatch repair DNA endonuclease (very short patch repair protein)